METMFYKFLQYCKLPFVIADKSENIFTKIISRLLAIPWIITICILMTLLWPVFYFLIYILDIKAEQRKIENAFLFESTTFFLTLYVFINLFIVGCVIAPWVICSSSFLSFVIGVYIMFDFIHLVISIDL
jgi:hypothetical protein